MGGRERGATRNIAAQYILHAWGGGRGATRNIAAQYQSLILCCAYSVTVSVQTLSTVLANQLSYVTPPHDGLKPGIAHTARLVELIPINTVAQYQMSNG